jgi:hypothetical protein
VRAVASAFAWSLYMLSAMSDELLGYTLGEVIDRDGFVRRQRAKLDGRDVVVTRCAAAPGAPIADIVERTAEASKPLEGIVRITHVGRDASGQPFIVSPVLGGERLSTRMGKGPIPREQMLWLALDLARALAAAHSLTPSLAHGGIRPSAVWIDEKGFARLDDYGIGAVMGSIAQSDSTILEMTARYQSPDHQNGGALPPEADRFALASVIFEAITGKPAFEGDSSVAVLMKISMGKPRGVDPLIGPELHGLLTSCWARDRRKRIGASALVSTLETLAGPVDPRLPPPAPAKPVVPAVAEAPRDEDFDPYNIPTERSVEIPNHVDHVIAPSPPERTLLLEPMPILPVQIPLAPHRRPPPRPTPVLPPQDGPTLRGETMAIAEILATVGQPIPEPIEETPIQLAPVVPPTPEVMEWRLLWTLVGLGVAVTMLLFTLLAVIAGTA